MLKRFLKNERGLTLIELLAVVVILGIIAAIAVPSIGGLIDNSKKDAHVANAQQMINSAKIAVTGNVNLLPKTTDTGKKKDITLEKLIKDGYIDPIKDPDGKTNKDINDKDVIGYEIKKSKVEISTENGKTFEYSVYLTNGTRSVMTSDKKPVKEADLNRDAVQDGIAE